MQRDLSIVDRDASDRMISGLSNPYISINTINNPVEEEKVQVAATINNNDLPESTTELNVIRLKTLMTSVNEQFARNEVNIIDFTETYFEWTKMFYHLGKALAAAFKDISGKATDMRNNQDLYQKEYKFMGSLQQFVEKESEFGVQELNGENNKTIIKKFKKEQVLPWMNNYTSTSRHLYRGSWFFDFLAEIFRGFTEDRKSKLSKIAADAYNKALGPHHPFLLRKVASAAMVAVNSRQDFLKNVTTE